MPQIDQVTKELSLPGPVAKYLRAVNAGATDEFRASFADDAVVVDVNRELSGLDAITDWASADIFGAHVHFHALNVTERQGRTIVTLKVDGTFDRTGLPDPLVMDHEFKLAEGKIAELRIGFERTR
jgi:alkyl hydroperoxide reductase subunit AhpF